ncbi:hypothetical protein JT359_04820 [Candidatus Poribacteria bacterium]|nr:hypothetical protein [Candidatus Poribacteria bacterium]
MFSFINLFERLNRHLRISYLFLICIPIYLITILYSGCANTEDYANPFDIDNLRTAGSPDKFRLHAGDRQVRVTWAETDSEGIKSYKIYRRSISNSDEPFELVGTVDAPKNEFVDTQNIQNDRVDSLGRILSYEYRISYVDVNGIETPDPKNPPSPDEVPLRIWQSAEVTPSVPPPAPVVTIGTPSDLTVKLFWEGYEFPDDFSLFRVYIARDEGIGRSPAFRVSHDIKPDQNYFFDLTFRKDGEAKVYRVAGVDKFGVEAITSISATSPHLPPAPPKNFRVAIVPRSLFNNKYDAIMRWDVNTEFDLAGYQIYSKDSKGNLIPRRTLNRRENGVTISGEDPLVINQEAVNKEYFITAFDDTPGPDGKRDESELVGSN